MFFFYPFGSQKFICDYIFNHFGGQFTVKLSHFLPKIPKKSILRPKLAQNDHELYQKSPEKVFHPFDSQNLHY